MSSDINEGKPVVNVPTWDTYGGLCELWDALMDVRYDSNMPQVFVDIAEETMERMPLFVCHALPPAVEKHGAGG